MKTAITILFLVVPVAMIYAQTLTDTLSGNPPKGFQPGYVILADSTRLHGYIRNNIRHWATVQTYSMTEEKPPGRLRSYAKPLSRQTGMWWWKENGIWCWNPGQG